MSELPDNQRVVVTGLGAVTPIGLDVDSFFNGLISGKNGISRVDAFDTEKFTCKIGGQIRDFDPAAAMDPKEARRNDRFVQFAFAAAKEAVEQSGLEFDKEDPERIGVFVGSGIGGMDTMEKNAQKLIEGGPRKVSPFLIPALISNMASGVLAIEYGAMGPNFSIVSACATGAHAIGEALKTIRLGEADVMICGGSEATITPLAYAGFCSMKAMTTNNDDPEHASRPFDAGRDGFVMGEGAGIIVIESLEHAKKRGANIICEVAGYGASCDANHITAPHPEGKGLISAMKRALHSANLNAEQIEYINAHGTSTPYNDKFETAAVRGLFGAHADKLMISSTKSMTGHLLGAAGGIESVACAKMLQEGKIAPTMNLQTPDPDCDLDYVPNEARDAKLSVTMSNSLGFGGQNASLIFRSV
ncbi:beta-ketoacyl-ACP synthase II [Pelagicoccus sp. SDUM812005]|uniref:beta-ketoacyl-ACP synthase II n=1 Tax=Pelagicoccus sp. SDUM812005 TaxID=3041257 RepID=UPI00280F897C|nr:beta-ketoacyl-ACP synthase II [Pelagicoccus sp. SDUM812005]MDQ8181840.1 beta-ketoacyl-ACP synthase II [Pelagicoccus sp. SDUM812005]